MQIWREEVFGPVLCVKTFSTEDEAIELANDTQWVDYFVSFMTIKITWNSSWVPFPLGILFFGLGGVVVREGGGYYFLYSFGQLVWFGIFLFWVFWHLILIFHRYGLGAAVISNDLERCDRVSKVRLDLCLKELRNHLNPKYSWKP